MLALVPGLFGTSTRAGRNWHKTEEGVCGAWIIHVREEEPLLQRTG